MLHRARIHVATNRLMVAGAQPDPLKRYPNSARNDFFLREPAKDLTHFFHFDGTVSTGRQLTEMELHFCKYPWFAKHILGLQAPGVWQPTMLSGSANYVASLSTYMHENGLDMVANFIHGFDTSSLNGFMHALALSEGVHELGVAVSEMSWPSHGKPLFTAYVSDMSNNAASVPASDAQLDLDIAAAGGADKVMVVTHSLGAPMLLQKLLNRYNRSLGKPEKLHSIWLVSPDLDTHEFLNCYVDALRASAHHVFVLVSERDLPLRLSELFREFGVDNNHPRLGQAKNPPIIPGITFVDDTENDHGILGHMLRMRTIALILRELMGKPSKNKLGVHPGFIHNRSICEEVRGGESPHYIVKRPHLW
ncbi:MAG: alpha/beta hydrolase [Candidatus Obscuribacterales bacterium]|nr:alpha/beta hydrolase [Candidatus Obscuribacterales bacterium]